MCVNVCFYFCGLQKKLLCERSNCSGSSTLETDVYVWFYALIVVHAIKEEEDVKSSKFKVQFFK